MIDKPTAIALLAEHNPNKLHMVGMYVSSFLTYLEAQENIERNGSIVAHPRTGSPMENPYLKVRTAAMNDMLKCGGIKGLAQLWEVVQGDSNAITS